MIESIKTYINPDRSTWAQLATRPSHNAADLKSLVSGVFDRVSAEGDEALLDYTKQFDGVALKSLRLSDQQISKACSLCDDQLKESIEVAYNNIKKFHLSQRGAIERIETTAGVTCWRESRGIEAVGLYIPGGTAPLFSTVLMLAVPAQIAGCKRVILCSPPNKDETLHPAIVYAATLCGLSEIYTIGGSQAVAAMALGTKTIPKVHKIFGPGNQYVTAAKILSQDFGTSIDLPAGPSEVLVFADAGANPGYIAADLLSQAEHGVDSQTILVATNAQIFDDVLTCLNEQLEDLPRREIAAKALKNSIFLCFDEVSVAFNFINQYAPEHLIILSDEPESYIPNIINAGSVFLGHLTPESAGDYASGTNHTLPTAGYARSYSGVSLDSFVKKITFQKITKTGLQNLGPHIINMAEAEELSGHARAVSIRLNDLNN